MDIRAIYAACMRDDTGILLLAGDAGKARDSPFALYCDYHADPDMKDPPDPYLEGLLQRGIEHEKNILEADYPGLEPPPRAEEGFMVTLEGMAAGIQAVTQAPLFYLPDGMHGYADILERQRGRSVFGGHHYTVREIKLARNIKEKHIVQAAFYAYMLGRIQQRPPETFCITNGDGDTFEYAYGEYERLMIESIKTARRIRDGWMPPATYRGVEHTWSGYCNDMAKQNNDVTLVPGIGVGIRPAMIKAGFDTVQSIASSTAAELRSIKGVGPRKASKYLDAARAISTGECVRRSGPLNLPKRSVEIFLDLEGLGDMSDDTISDYLIGALVRTGGTERYYPFIAEQKREHDMLGSFLDFVAGLDDYVMYHWHHYERTHLRSMMKRHGLHAHHILESHVMLDLHRITTAAFAFPTYRDSIKDVAKWMGFEWEHDDVQ